MANIKQTDKLLLENLFKMENGYVLEFSNPSFQDFIFNVCKIDIYDSKYAVHGDSKAKRLRMFWQIESDETVGRLINEMLAHLKTKNKINGIELNRTEKIIFNDCLKIANKLRGVPDKRQEDIELSKNEFLKKDYGEISLDKLSLDSTITEILKNRLSEIQNSIKSRSSLSVVILCGSVLEGILLGLAMRKTEEFNRSPSSPRNKDTGTVLPFYQWTLSNFIDVAHNLGLLGLDVKKFSHSLRDFRNYIHPYEQMSKNFNPDIDTAKISWQVLLAAINDLTEKNC